MTEDTLSLAESEGLARVAGSFTVHGKKASVVTFGSEWQDMSPEERLKLRKAASQGEESRSPVPSALDGETPAAGFVPSPRNRPLSTVSVSTNTTISVVVESEFTGDFVLDHGITPQDVSLPTTETRISQSVVA